jgi:hypothetical protein
VKEKSVESMYSEVINIARQLTTRLEDTRKKELMSRKKSACQSLAFDSPPPKPAKYRHERFTLNRPITVIRKPEARLGYLLALATQPVTYLSTRWGEGRGGVGGKERRVVGWGGVCGGGGKGLMVTVALGCRIYPRRALPSLFCSVFYERVSEAASFVSPYTTAAKVISNDTFDDESESGFLPH